MVAHEAHVAVRIRVAGHAVVRRGRRESVAHEIARAAEHGVLKPLRKHELGTSVDQRSVTTHSLERPHELTLSHRCRRDGVVARREAEEGRRGDRAAGVLR